MLHGALRKKLRFPEPNDAMSAAAQERSRNKPRSFAQDAMAQVKWKIHGKVLACMCATSRRAQPVEEKAKS